MGAIFSKVFVFAVHCPTVIRSKLQVKNKRQLSRRNTWNILEKEIHKMFSPQ